MILFDRYKQNEDRKMQGFLKNKLNELTCKNIVTKLIIAIIAVSLYETAFSPYTFNTTEFVTSISFTMHILAICVLFLILFFVLNEKYDGYIIMILLTALFLKTNYDYRNTYFALVCSCVLFGFVFYFSNKIKPININNRLTVMLTAFFGLLLFLFVGSITIVKYLNHLTPNYDFGIFSQVFHYMKETFLPLATCERDRLLSHFAVHFSPILYIALPIYYIFPDPSTILAVQALVVALGVIPIYKLSKHIGLSNNKTLCIILMYILHPTVIANNFYYFHENCFLATLLLFLFYYAEKNKNIPTYIFALLVMTVKEDAPVYVMFFGLYLLFSNKSKIKGAILCCMSAVYFAVVTKIMSVYGLGIMSYRYDNFLFGDDSIYSVVANVIKNPTYVFTQIFETNDYGDPRKMIVFLILMLIPLALIPFMIKKPARIILLFPFVLINLMTTYVYQYDIGFQYTYGSIAFLFYLVILNIKDLSPKLSKNLLICGVCASLVFFASANLHRIKAFEYYQDDAEEIEAINEAIKTVPKNKSVKTTTLLLPALSERDIIYEIHYSDKKTDYVVLDLRGYSQNDVMKFYNTELDEYERIFYEEDVIAVYKAKSDAE